MQLEPSHQTGSSKPWLLSAQLPDMPGAVHWQQPSEVLLQACHSSCIVACLQHKVFLHSALSQMHRSLQHCTFSTSWRSWPPFPRLALTGMSLPKLPHTCMTATNTQAPPGNSAVVSTAWTVVQGLGTLHKALWPAGSCTSSSRSCLPA